MIFQWSLRPEALQSQKTDLNMNINYYHYAVYLSFECISLFFFLFLCFSTFFICCSKSIVFENIMVLLQSFNKFFVLLEVNGAIHNSSSVSGLSNYFLSATKETK